MLAQRFDSIGYQNGAGRVWEVEDRVWLPLYEETMKAIGRNAQTVDISTTLYHLAEERVGGDKKLPPLWMDAIDVDAEMSRLFGGRRFDADFVRDARLTMGAGSVRGVVLATEPQKLIVTEVAGTMSCEVWTSFIAEGDKWRKEAEAGKEEGGNCYRGGEIITLADAYYTARLENYDRIALAPIIGLPECEVGLRFDSRLTMRLTPVSQGDAVVAAIAADLVAILASYQDAGSKADWTGAVGNFTPEDAPKDFADSILLKDTRMAHGPLPILGIETDSKAQADARKTGDRYQLDGQVSGSPRALYESLRVIPGGEADPWNELDGTTVQFFGYGGRHFIWVVGTPHIGWRDLSVPGFGVFELVDGNPIGRLGGHIRYIMKYQGAHAN